MRTRTEIKEELLSRLGATWTAVKDSVVGKELLSLGVEAVMYAEEVNESIKTAFDTATADKEMLIAMSHVYRLPISFVKPATVTIKVTDGGYFAPYTLCLTKGSVSYYNIEYVNAYNEVTLYQGVYTTIDSPTMKTIPTDTLEDRIGYVVDETIPQSIYAYTYAYIFASPINPLSSYTEDDDKMSIYTLSDAKLFIEYHKPLNRIEYLKPTKGTVDLTNAVLNSNMAYTVLATSDYEEDSLETARNYFNKFYYEMNAVSSKSQIRKYVNTFPNVLDCNPIADSSNSITVYVKPTDQGQQIATFGEIESALDLHGIIGVIHKVTLGTPYPIQFICSNVSIDKQADVATLIADSFKYETTKYDESLSINLLSARIREELGVSTDIRIRIAQESIVSGDTLKFKIIRGTLNVLQRNGNDYINIGYDANGAIYILEVSDSTPTVIGASDGHYGDIVRRNIVSDTPNVYFNENATTLVMFKPTQYGDSSRLLCDGGFVYEIGTDDTMRVYNRDDVSYQNFLTGQVYPITPSGYPINNLSGFLYCSLYLNGVLVVLHDVASSLVFSFLDNIGNEYYTRATSISDTIQYKGNIFFEDSWYIFIEDNGANKCLVYRNIGTSREELTVQTYDFGIDVVKYVGSNGVGDVVAFGVHSNGEGIRVSYSYGLAVTSSGITTTGARVQDFDFQVDNTTLFHEICRCSNFIDFFISQGTELYRIYDNTTDVVVPEGAVVKKQESPVGTIDYRTCRVALNRNDLTVSYEATSLNDTLDDEYVVLDDVEPVLFD